LALTLPAYVTEFEGTFLIEEPENEIHPKAAEAVYQSLSSVYAAQVLMATHSPVMLSLVEPDQVLCFAKDEQGQPTLWWGQDIRPWQSGTASPT
jgi:predicted ATPase